MEAKAETVGKLQRRGQGCERFRRGRLVNEASANLERRQPVDTARRVRPLLLNFRLVLPRTGLQRMVLLLAYGGRVRRVESRRVDERNRRSLVRQSGRKLADRAQGKTRALVRRKRQHDQKHDVASC